MTVRNALRELVSLAYMKGTPAQEVAFTGGDPVFPTPYLVGTAGAAALGAVGLAVADLWRLKTGRLQNVTVDVRAAAAALRGAHYLRIDGKPPKAPWDPLSGYYPVKDGRWVSIHCNFPNHRDAAMRVLGMPVGGAPDRAPPSGRNIRTRRPWQCSLCLRSVKLVKQNQNHSPLVCGRSPRCGCWT